MAKKSVIARQKKREKLVAKYAQKRSKLKAIIANINSSYDERVEAQQALQKLPLNSSPTRLRRRCAITGRPRGVYRKFGLSRSFLRIHLMNGDIPGGRKASW